MLLNEIYTYFGKLLLNLWMWNEHNKKKMNARLAKRKKKKNGDDYYFLSNRM